MNILIVKSSAQGDASVSSRLADHFAAEALAAFPGARVVERDVGRQPLPHLIPETVAGVRAQASSAAEHEAASLSDQVVAEVRAADIVVIASPMYNFGISSTLKSWFDHLLRPRVAFRYVDGAPQGLLGGRKVIVIESRAGFYSEGAGAVMDGQEKHLRAMLTFAGLDDVDFVRAEKLAYGADAAAASIAQAEAVLTGLAREKLPLAA
jgi:FMN-dependent NADH-azoreductase